MKREFDVVPPDLRLTWWLPALAFIAGLAGIAFAARQDAAAWLVSPVLLLAIVLIGVAVQRRRVVLDEGVLRIDAGFTSRRIPVSELLPAQARIVNLAERIEMRPWLKSFGLGTRLPGYCAGYFRARDRVRIFALVTDSSRVLVLPETSGRRLLLSLKQPQALLDALRALESAHLRPSG